MTTTDTTSHRVSPSALRVRRHRERRREGLSLFTIEVPEANIEQAIARGLLKPEDRAKSWPVIQAVYASLLSNAALDRLIGSGMIKPEDRGDAVAILRAVSKWLERP